MMLVELTTSAMSSVHVPDSNTESPHQATVYRTTINCIHWKLQQLHIKPMLERILCCLCTCTHNSCHFLQVIWWSYDKSFGSRRCWLKRVSWPRSSCCDCWEHACCKFGQDTKYRSQLLRLVNDHNQWGHSAHSTWLKYTVQYSPLDHVWPAAMLVYKSAQLDHDCQQCFVWVQQATINFRAKNCEEAPMCNTINVWLHGW